MKSFNSITAFLLGTFLFIACNNKLEINNVIEENNSDTVYVVKNTPNSVKDNNINNEEPNDVLATDEATTVSDFNSMKWVRNKDGHFSYPSCFSTKEEVIEELPATLETYSYDDIELCYWPLLGFWATLTDNYPIVGSLVGKNSTIQKITYTSNTGIYSGYTDDNRIFYMKTLISGGEVHHAHSLALIYPKSKQKIVERLIKEVQHWKLPYAE